MTAQLDMVLEIRLRSMQEEEEEEEAAVMVVGDALFVARL